AFPLLSDDIDDAGDGVIAIKHRAAAANDLNAFNGAQWHLHEIRPRHIDVVDLTAVHQHQHVSAGRVAKAADIDAAGFDRPRFRDEYAQDAGKRIGNVLGAGGFDPLFG